MKNAVFVLVALLPALTCQARIITVDDDGPPADFNNIQAAIDDANDGDTVELQTGRYIGLGSRNIDFKGKAITVRSTNPNDPNIVANTIIDCNGVGRGFYFHSDEDANSVLAGLTITNGNAGNGAAILCRDASPLITNCTLTGNAEGLGGVIRCEMQNPYPWSPPPTTKILKCNICGNSGAGIRCYRGGTSPSSEIGLTIADCTITDNSGTGVSECAGSLTNCTIARNGGEGGVYKFKGDISNCVISDNSNSGIANCHGTISDCTITGNATVDAGRGEAGVGGGIRCSDRGGITSKISNCVISGNSASRYGGGIYCSARSPEIVNCLITGNDSFREGGAIYLYQSTSTIANCTIVQNCGTIRGVFSYGGAPTITNCVLWDHGSEIWLKGGSITVSWSNVKRGQGGVHLAEGCTLNWGPGNIETDPGFTSNYHLKHDSPCIDAGDPAYTPDPCTTDIDEEQRVCNGRVDMGSDEFLDTDGDGLPDWWEAEHFGSTTAAESTGNPDNDTWPNIEEYPYGSDPLSSSDYYVHPTDGNDTWDGLAMAWDGHHGPKKTIQAAVDACPAGQVFLAQATYTGDGNRDIDLKGKPIIVSSLNPQDPNVVAATVIDCQGSKSEPHRGFSLNSHEGAYSTISGLTITRGWAGAICAEHARARPTVTLCNIIGNRGPALYGSFNTITKCKVMENYGATRGGGLSGWADKIEDCIFTGNTAEDGGGLCTSGTHISRCVISNNCAGRYGGGINTEYSFLTITNSLITGNKSPNGGAMYAIGGIVTFNNSTIADNLANSGGAMYLRDSSATFANSIVWGNLGSQANFGHVSFSDIQGGHLGTGNINADPCFADPGHWEDPCNTPDDVRDDVWFDGDYHLKSQAGRWDPNTSTWVVDSNTSPCIDRGGPMSPIGPEPFPTGGIVNMGAYGGTAEASKSYFGEPVCETIVAGDVNGDCVVNFLDFRLMALHWLGGNRH